MRGVLLFALPKEVSEDKTLFEAIARYAQPRGRDPVLIIAAQQFLGTGMNLDGKARAASGAPVKCNYKPGAGWIEQTQNGAIACRIDPPKAEVKK